MPPRLTFFATCAPGLEAVLHEEVRALKLARVERQVGGVRFEGTMRDAWRANLWLRTAIRVLRRLERFEARDADELYRGIGAVDWKRFLAREGSLRVDAQSKESSLDHTRFIEQRTKDAIVDQLRAGEVRPAVERDDPDLRVHVHVFRDRVTLSVDTSGDSLHRRGWRRFQGRAPLAETTAAAIVQLSGWDLRSPVLDPFCGSATILIEAALLAARIAPGSLGRSFGFERWPGHDGAGFAAAVAAARRERAVPRKLRLVGSDASPEAIEGARANLRQVGLDGMVELAVADALERTERPGWNAWIVTNPPYGERVGVPAELLVLFEGLGAKWRAEARGYHLALLSGNSDLTRALGFHGASRTALENGSLACELLCQRLD